MIAAQDLHTEFQFPQEAESQLSSDTDLEDPDGKNAKTGRGMVCFSNRISCADPSMHLLQGHAVKS
uniref:Uncharacterized protein n=1 Tax=Labrus bergylta TaxID=56723 RepID=A0A3Q3EDY6_9LABR